MNREENAREVRLRYRARKRGLVLERNRARRADAPDVGTYGLTRTVGTGNARRVVVVAGDPATGYGLNLDAVERYLEGLDR